jgi:hypothetical protein
VLGTVHLQLEDEIIVAECGGPERGAGGSELREETLLKQAQKS